MIITVDRLSELKANEWTEDYGVIEPEKIRSYKIIDSRNKTTGHGRYIFIFGYRIGFHKDSPQCKLVLNYEHK